MIESMKDLFELGMDRPLEHIIPDVSVTTKEPVLNLGPGKKHIVGAYPLEYPDWDAEIDEIPFDDETVAQIHAYHFFEHLQNPRHALAECNRVLMPGGHINIVVPYYKSNMAFQDLDHKSFYTEDTWKTLLDNPYYTKNRIGVDWKLKIHFNMIMGVTERNMALVTQLVKGY